MGCSELPQCNHDRSRCGTIAEPTEATITGITRADVVAWHKKYWGANNAILVVSGAFMVILYVNGGDGR